jgi:integrase
MNTPCPTPTTSLLDTSQLVYSFLESGKRRGLSTWSIKWYRQFLIRYGKLYPELPVDDPEIIDNFVGSHKSSDIQRHNAYRALRAFYNYLEHKKVITSIINPVKQTYPPVVKRREKPYLSLEQVKELLNYPLHRPITKVLLYFMCDTGCRIGETRYLTKDSFYEQDDGPVVKLNVSGKTGERIIPISPAVRDMVMYLPGDKPFDYTVRHLSGLVKEGMLKVGIKGNAHLLRHTFCSLYEGDIVSLRAITGHTNIRMVENYRHNKLGHAIKQHKQGSPIALINGNGNNGITKFSENGNNSNPPESINNQADILLRLVESLGEIKYRLDRLESALKVGG